MVGVVDVDLLVALLLDVLVGELRGEIQVCSWIRCLRASCWSSS